MRLPGLHYNGFAVEQHSESAVSKESKQASAEEPMLYCPVCSRRLTERKCKLFCEQCGYYMSCADYY
jgi:methionyl-tRNA synthetase